ARSPPFAGSQTSLLASHPLHASLWPPRITYQNPHQNDSQEPRDYKANFNELLVSTPGAWSGVGVPLTRKLDVADTKASEEAVTFGRESEYLPCQQSLESFMERSLIDISALDVQVQEQVAKYGNVKDFHVVLWRQDPDTAG